MIISQDTVSVSSMSLFRIVSRCGNVGFSRIAHHSPKSYFLKGTAYNSMQYRFSAIAHSAMRTVTLNHVRARSDYSTGAFDGSNVVSEFLGNLLAEDFNGLYKLIGSFYGGVGKTYDDALAFLESVLDKSHMPEASRKKILDHFKQLPADVALDLVKKALTSSMISNHSIQDQEVVISASLRPKLATIGDLQFPSTKVAEEKSILAAPRVIEFCLSKHDWTPFSHVDIKDRFHLLCITLGVPHDQIQSLSDLASFSGANGYDIVPLFICHANESEPSFLKKLVEGLHPNLVALTGPRKDVNQLCYAYYYASNLFVFSHKRSNAVYLVSPAGHLVKAMKLNNPWVKFELLAAMKMCS